MSFKKITSLTIAISFLVMTYTGIMLFLSPHGRVAYWTDWKLFGLGKDDYGNIHTTSMVIFVIFVAIHIYYNWKPLISYLKDASKKISFTKKEFVVAVAINAIFVGGTLLNIQPFKGFLDWEESIKASWEKRLDKVPYGHAELDTLMEFAKKTQLNVDEIKKALKAKGIKFKDGETIKDIADKNGLTPAELFKLFPKNKELQSTPLGLGKKSLNEIKDSIDLEKLKALLKDKDIDMSAKLRELAPKLNLTPYELYQKIKK